MAKHRRFLSAISVLCGTGIIIGGFLANTDITSTASGDVFDAKLYEELKTFTDVLSIVQRDYVDEVAGQRLVEGAIKGMLGELDPHSGYLSPDFYSELQVETSGEFGGLGIEITLKDNLLVVVAPIEGSPAEDVGLQAGDAIVKIDGKFAKDLSLVDAVRKMRGPKGTAITISVYRKGFKDLLDFVITRDIIRVKSVRGRPLEPGFGYIRISQFQEHTAEDMEAVLERIKTGSGRILQGLILDLRNNPGGLLTQAIKVGDMFLNEGVIVYTDGRKEGQKKKFFAHSRGTEASYPLIVLVNGGSASASEIIAGALKDHGRALILGTKTFGKGSVQTIMPLNNGGALKLTTALYYTKSGRSIQAMGVDPDVVMEMPQQTETTSNSSNHDNSVMHLDDKIRESDLPGAIKNPTRNGEKLDNGSLRQKKVTVEEPTSKKESFETMELTQLLNSDPQLERALELLKTYNIFKRE